MIKNMLHLPRDTGMVVGLENCISRTIFNSKKMRVNLYTGTEVLFNCQTPSEIRVLNTNMFGENPFKEPGMVTQDTT